MSAKNTGLVKFRLDPANPPQMTPDQRRRLRAITDEQIDTSDLPETTGVAWVRPGALVTAEPKSQLTLRVDSDVLAYFRSTGRKYQTRMNLVLRAYMEAQQATPKQRKRA